MSTADLRSRIAVEVERRLAVARAATPGPWEVGGEGRREPKHPRGETYTVSVEDDERCRWVADTWDEPDAVLIALHDPADAERRYSAALRVLNRHAPGYPGEVEYDTHVERTESGRFVEVRNAEPNPPYWCEACSLPHPCPEVLDVGAGLDITEGSTTDG